MDNDRIEGSAKTMMGRVKSFLGGLFGDSKMKADGKMDRAEGRFQGRGAQAQGRRQEGRRGPLGRREDLRPGVNRA